MGIKSIFNKLLGREQAVEVPKDLDTGIEESSKLIEDTREDISETLSGPTMAEHFEAALQQITKADIQYIQDAGFSDIASFLKNPSGTLTPEGMKISSANEALSYVQKWTFVFQSTEFKDIFFEKYSQSITEEKWNTVFYQLTPTIVSEHEHGISQSYPLRSFGEGGFGEATLVLRVEPASPLHLSVALAKSQKKLQVTSQLEAEDSYQKTFRKQMNNAFAYEKKVAQRLQELASGDDYPDSLMKTYHTNDEILLYNEYTYKGAPCALKDSLRAGNGTISKHNVDIAIPQILNDCLDSISFLHKNNLVHMDIHPRNIMLWDDVEGNLRGGLIDIGTISSSDPEDLQNTEVKRNYIIGPHLESKDATEKINELGWVHPMVDIKGLIGVVAKLRNHCRQLNMNYFQQLKRIEDYLQRSYDSLCAKYTSRDVSPEQARIEVQEVFQGVRSMMMALQAPHLEKVA